MCVVRWLACAFVVAAVAGSAHAQELYGWRRTPLGGFLYRVEAATGAERPITSLDFGYVIHALDANRHRLFMAGELISSATTGPVTAPGQAVQQRIVTVSLVDGEVQSSPVMGAGDTALFGLGYDAAAGVLYGLRQTARGRMQLCRVNPTSGAVTAMGTGTAVALSRTAVAALDAPGQRFSFVGSTTDFGPQQIFTFDLADGGIGAAPLVSGSAQGPILALAYDPQGRLFGLRRLGDGGVRLETVNPATGAAVPLGAPSDPGTWPLGADGVTLDAVHERVLASGFVGSEARLLAFDTRTGAVSAFPVAPGVQYSLLAWRETTPMKGDFDRDGRTDLLLRRGSTHQAQVWLMNGTARRTTASIAPTPSADEQIVGVDDFNANGVNDLVVYRPSTRAVSFWMLAADGRTRSGNALPLMEVDPVTHALGAAAPRPAAWRIDATGDFDHDGWPDLVWRNATTGTIDIWRVIATIHVGTLVPSPAEAGDANWEVVAALDFDRDGNRDLLWYNTSSGRIVSWNLTAGARRISGAFTLPATAGDANWRVVAGGDYGVGPDGTDAAVPVIASNDIVWRNQTSGKLVVWHMDFDRQRTSGVFTTPDAPSPSPADWLVLGPR